MKTKVLFISHDAQPHGAQRLLLHLVRWVNETGALEAHVLLKRDGPLRTEFAAAAPTRVFDAGNPAGLLDQAGDGPLPLSQPAGRTDSRYPSGI